MPESLEIHDSAQEHIMFLFAGVVVAPVRLCHSQEGRDWPGREGFEAMNVLRLILYSDRWGTND